MLRPSVNPEPYSCGDGRTETVIPVDMAAAKALAIAGPVEAVENIQLRAAAGRVLAYRVLSPIQLPPFDNSAMDGYAVRTSDFEGSGPWDLQVTGRVTAGDAGILAGDTPGGTTLRIFTGAPIPEGFDAVIMQEHCEQQREAVNIRKLPRPGENIRFAGEDVARGRELVGAGETLSPRKLALLAAAGIATVDVYRRVRIGLISTGSELRELGEDLQPGQIYNSNRTMLRSILVAFPWAEIVDFGIIPDDPDVLGEIIGTATANCDAVITTGGVSAGEEDHMVGSVQRHGATLDVLKVAMRPGKPLKIGKIGRVLFAGLPGNPNAAMVTFRQIALPALRAMAGLADVHPRWFPAVAGFEYVKRHGRTEFVPVRVSGRDKDGTPVLEMLGRGSSASLMTMAQADGMAMLRPEASEIAVGTLLRYEPYFDC